MELRIKALNCEICIPFVSADDLETKLKDLEPVLKVMQRSLPGSLFEEARVKPGLEDIYYLGSDQVPVLLRVPESKVAAIGLAVHVSEPRGLSGAEIEAVCGVRNALKDYVYNQRYKKYFDARGGFVHVSHDGARWIIEEVLPSLPKRDETQ